MLGASISFQTNSAGWRCSWWIVVRGKVGGGGGGGGGSGALLELREELLELGYGAGWIQQAQTLPAS